MFLFVGAGLVWFSSGGSATCTKCLHDKCAKAVQANDEDKPGQGKNPCENKWLMDMIERPWFDHYVWEGLCKEHLQQMSGRRSLRWTKVIISIQKEI